MSIDSVIAVVDGGRMPAVGLGLWKIANEDCPRVVQDAIRLGYRHLDSACDYGNEKEVGEGLAAAIRDGLVTRDEVWVTSKLWNTYHRPENVRPALERTLSDLQLDELDLYHIHFPIPLAYIPFEQRYPPGWFFDPDAAAPSMKPDSVPYADVWGAMEELVDAGLVKRIGVCNLGTSQIRDLLSYARIKPSVLQVELHPYLTQKSLVRFAQESGIAVTGFSPLGAMSYQPLGMAGDDESVLDTEVVRDIAATHDRSPAQVVLRWGVQRGTSVIPKSANAAHLADNLNLFDFALSGSEMSRIDGLDQHRRFNDPGVFGEAAFNTFVPIFD